MGPQLTQEQMESEHAELLELSDIAPETTNPDMAEMLDHLSPQELAWAIGKADGVISI